MDPLTQGLLGAAAGEAIFGKKIPRLAGLAGLLAGWIPDFDTFWINAADPVHGWIYHRHFTHSLLFIPVGGLLAALPFIWTKKGKKYRKEIIGAGIAGCATHGVLDAATSYGTQLFLPFTNYRVAWDVLPIVDLFFTPVLLLGVVLGLIIKNPIPARVALGIAAAYVGIGILNNHRASDAQRYLAEQRGHTIERGRVLPSPGTLVLWRSVYLHDGRLYADGVRTPYFAEKLVKEGESRDRLTWPEFEEALGIDSPKIERAWRVFTWFADDYVALVPSESESVVIGDMRYSRTVEKFLPIWGLEFYPDGTIERWSPRSQREGYRQSLWSLLTEGDPSYVPVDELDTTIEEAKATRNR